MGILATLVAGCGGVSGGGATSDDTRPTLQSSVDECPNDPDKVAAGQCGCGQSDRDSDGDGTADCIDACIDDPDKTAEGLCGCGNSDQDGDRDGTPDCDDACPEDATKVESGICGCGISDNDSDNDGTADCVDDCPIDPERTVDDDTDGDGTADCADACPLNPNKVAPGFCGCSDEIFNPDGSVDCDQCPDDPDKLVAGACGCGTPETDGDGDGVPDCVDECPDNPERSSAGVITCEVTFDDPTATYAEYHNVIESNLVAACLDWGRYLNAPSPVVLSIEVGFCVNGSTPGCSGWSPQAIAAGRSSTTVYVRSTADYDVFEPGTASEVRTGVDPNGDFPDAEVIMGVNFLDALWFDPEPETRTAPVGDLDAYSVFLHELGHALAFNGWRDVFSGELPGVASPYDVFTVGGPGAFSFEGPQAQLEYGGPIPLDASIYHIDSTSDLMKPTASYQTRLYISDLELAVLQDVDVPLRDPSEIGADACAAGAPLSARSSRVIHLGPQLPLRADDH